MSDITLKSILVVTHYSKLYGANKSLLKSLELLRAEYRFTVLVPEIGPLTECLIKLEIPFINNPFEVDIFDPTNLKSQLAKKRRVRFRDSQKNELLRRIENSKPDLIYSNSSVTLLGSFLSEHLNIPHIWHFRENIFDHYHRTYDSKKSADKSFRQSTTILVPGNYIKQMIASRFGHHPNIIQIHNPIDEAVDTNIQRVDGQIHIGVVGLIHPKKNQLFTLKALGPHLNNLNLKLHFFGDGDTIIKGQMLKMVEDNSLQSNVSFHGRVNDVNRIFNSFDILINMSEHEAFGRVNLEAMLHGVPVIGLNSGATPEIVEHNATGLIVEKTAESLLEAVKGLLDSEIRNRMGLNAKRVYSKRYSNVQYKGQFKSILDATFLT